MCHVLVYSFSFFVCARFWFCVLRVCVCVSVNRFLNNVYV